MATFGHFTREFCAQLGRALTAAGLSWTDNGRQDKPEFLTYTATDAHGREWSISPTTSNQITPSRPREYLAGPVHRADAPVSGPVRRAVVDHIGAFPA
ncbi:hypothetical protein [Streptomyces sp. CoT10]|uniref:hypothetical protein n=1 Tax=Streptomyces sp. CoT10 TaxID=2875762 RepID=UPI001CD1DC2C|nr:hypothetical protein [Streptomyces sp. CoT10]